MSVLFEAAIAQLDEAKDPLDDPDRMLDPPASALLSYPAPELLALGYAELAARHPQKALQQFDRAAASLPPGHEGRDSQRFFASLAHGRAMAWSALAQQR